jgi:hypothetical protein
MFLQQLAKGARGTHCYEKEPSERIFHSLNALQIRDPYISSQFQYEPAFHFHIPRGTGSHNKNTQQYVKEQGPRYGHV